MQTPYTVRHGILVTAAACIAAVLSSVVACQGESPRDADGSVRQRAIAALKEWNAAVEEHAAIDNEPSWTVIDLGFTQVTDRGLTPLKAISDLRKLYLYNAKITGAGLQVLEDATGLEVLFLEGCRRVDDKGLSHLAGLSKLRVLSLGRCRLVSDEGLAQLKGLTALRELDLNGTNVTNAGLTLLSGLENLESLNLDGAIDRRSQIDDTGLVHLTKLKNLNRLHLVDAKITDAGIENLAKLTHLQHLDLQFCRQITQRGVDKLRRALPDCEIER